ncbi:hypothetical protein [Roseateles amylovorans]|uniref:Lipoprotein n=1 Tax=Roseateles amylovorans TaxID=2978473 RepID=A0ABY6B2K0_9BURK|nr:hypothetical protein [Roseateles amylovorans]UXH79404.1 hypothetical protein N4261_05605 [Roseateles amylovorans]
MSVSAFFPSFQRCRVALLLTLASAAVGGLTACSRSPSYDGPELSSWESHQHQRCVALLTQMWGNERVRHTSAERGAGGLDYVWVNVDVDDDRDDIDRRTSRGSRHAGHCQFEAGSDAVHIHTYALTEGAVAGADGRDAGYRFFTASANETVAVADDAPAR